MPVDPEDQWWADGPEFDERGYQIITDENGEPILEQELDKNEEPMFDEYGEPIMNYAAGYSCMQTEAVVLTPDGVRRQ